MLTDATVGIQVFFSPFGPDVSRSVASAPSMTYPDVNHRPKSTNLHRSLQKGKYGI